MNEIWKSPVPSTAYLREPRLLCHPKRRYVLELSWEADKAVAECRIEFSDVEAVRVTHLWSLSDEMLTSSYDRLVEVSPSDWAKSAMGVQRGRPVSVLLKHVRICFDDGPCYEFICPRVEVQMSVAG